MRMQIFGLYHLKSKIMEYESYSMYTECICLKREAIIWRIALDILKHFQEYPDSFGTFWWLEFVDNAGLCGI